MKEEDKRSKPRKMQLYSRPREHQVQTRMRAWGTPE